MMKGSTNNHQNPLPSKKNKKKLVRDQKFSDFGSHLANKIIETTHALIIGLDKDHTIRKFNSGAEKASGYTREEVIGKDWFKLFIPKREFRETTKIWESIWGTNSTSYTSSLVQKNGQELVISWQITGIYEDDDDSKHFLVSIGKDITERISFDQQLEKFHAIFQQSPSVILITDENGNIEYVNPKFTITTGYGEHEVIGKTPNILKSGYHSPETYEKLWQTISSGGEWHGEFKNKKKDGKEFWELASISPIYNHQGKLTNYVKVAEDITDKKRTQFIQEILYHISSSIFSVNSIEDFISIIQKELGTIINVSNLYVAFYNNKDDSFTFPYYKDSKDSFTKINAAQTLSKIVVSTGKSLLANQEVKQRLIAEGKLISKGSYSKVWLGVPLKSGNSTIGVLAIQDYENENAYDSNDLLMLEFIANEIGVTIEKINKEIQLRESELIFEKLFNNLGDAVYVTMIEGKDRGKIIEVNHTACIQTGYSKEELLNMNIITNIVVANSAEIDMETWNKKLDRGEQINSKEKKRRKDGTEFWTEVVITPITYKGTKASLSINRDITDRIEAEEKVQKALEKAQESDKLKSAFLANMSHEIRTPMNGILGFASLLKEPELSQEEIDMYTDVIARSGQRLLSTVNNLIDISKLEVGQMKVVKTEVDINAQLENLFQFFKKQADDKSLTLSYHTDLANEAAIITTDLEKFYGIFTNLINNAIKYTLEGGVEFGYSIKEKGAKQQMEFYVKDTGIGIPKHIHHDIFDRFVQADLSLSSKFEGAGLGLAITKAYVELLHGRIWIESEENVGSTFYFTIETK